MLDLDEIKLRQIVIIRILNDERRFYSVNRRKLLEQFAVISRDTAVLLE
jgi:hypothetical protein